MMNDSSKFPPINEAADEKARRSLSENVIVAVKAGEKVVSKAALAWALAHVVHPRDCVILLAVFQGARSSRRLWSWRRLNGDCRNSDDCANLPDRICQISESCSRMVLQFQNQFEAMVQIKVVLGTPSGAVAAQAKYNAANWVIWDFRNKMIFSSERPKNHRFLILLFLILFIGLVLEIIGKILAGWGLFVTPYVF